MIKTIACIDALPVADVWISAITVGEIRLGLALLPEGRRRQTLSGLAEEMFQEEFFEKCLPFDYQAAEAYAQIVSSRSRQGRPIAVEDAQIAAIALSGELELATRDIKGFLGIEDLKLVNPWETDSV